MQFLLGASVDDFSANLPKLNHIAQHDYNTLFVGNSRTEHGINPVLFDSLLRSENIKSFNLAMGGFFMPDTEKLVKSALENSKSKIEYIFLELSTPSQLHHVQFSPDYEKEDYNFALNLLSRDFFKFISDGISTQSVLLQMSARHIKSLRSNMESDFYSIQKGYSPLAKPELEIDIAYNSGVHLGLLKKYDLQREGLTQSYFKRIQNLILYSKKRGSKLIVFLPYKLSENEADILVGVFNKLDSSHKLSPSNQLKFSSLFQKGNFADGIHLSEQGSNKYTEVFAEEFIDYLKM